MAVKMKPADLGELYVLLQLFDRTYETDTEALQKAVEAKYTDVSGKGIESINNPRNAGRKPKITAVQRQEVARLKASGLTVRAIAEQTGLSVGSVHKIISELKGEML